MNNNRNRPTNFGQHGGYNNSGASAGNPQQWNRRPRNNLENNQHQRRGTSFEQNDNRDFQQCPPNYNRHTHFRQYTQVNDNVPQSNNSEQFESDFSRNPNQRYTNRQRNKSANRQYKNDQSTPRNDNPRRSRDQSSDSTHQTGAPRGEYKQFRMAFKFAERIGENDNAEEVIQHLLNDRSGFLELLKESELSGDWLVLIAQMVAKVCDTSFVDSKTRIFHAVFIHSSYPKQLTSFISNLPNHGDRDQKRNAHFWEDTDKFWNNLITIFEDISKLPSFASQSLPTLLKAIKRTLPAIEEEHGIHISDSIKKNFDALLAKIQSMKEEYKQKAEETQIRRMRHEDEDDEQQNPPNDFREVYVYPNIIEVTSQINPFLRKNKIKGAYMNIDHYLDVQFRLLREDFIAPLRRGICQYLKDPNQRRYDDVRIYPKIHFLLKENFNELNCVRIKFDFNNTKKSFKYENSKLFLYGSLVCFTKDRFRSILFARIVKREPELLKKGELVVGFDNIEDISFHTDYIMVESSVYFEPYYHVLMALQRMSSDLFPMENYIIYAERECYRPRYLNDNTSYVIDNRRCFPVFWSNDNYYGLNESQGKAFRAALTREIAIIQGPPGTGKTFLALKIAQTLLANKDVWYISSPILVICYTNHALDQFLEGILPFTQKLLRIGGQSKNEALEKYNLKNTKRLKKSAAFYQSQHNLKVCLSDLKSCDDILSQILQYNGIIDFALFAGVIPDFLQTWFYSATRDEIKNWLLGTMEEDSTAFTCEKTRLVSQSTTIDSGGEEDEEDSEDDERVEEVDEIYRNINMTAFRPIITLESIKANIEDIEKRLGNTSQFSYGGENVLKWELFDLQKTYKYLESKLEKVKTPAEILNPNIPPHQMTSKQRWALYSNWLHQYCQFLKEKRERINDEYKEKHKIYCDQKNIEDVRVMKENLVIGMTTTGAARLRTSLEAVRSPIVIVEEAAEVLEAHLISALTVHCQHLILIGDHQQLKPSTADYKVETDYLLGVSLFERMVNNNLQCYRLNVQHRMKPEICDLIRPTIYPDLADHDSVRDRPSIKGVDRDLFFIHHEHAENTCDNATKKNTHEAKFLISFAKYLILNGYEAKSITILAAYLGQMFEMQREKKRHNLLLRNVRIAVLDNYQGEESDIILLSLVRNNNDGRIGFLRIENRVCVALSRARNGLYIMGNINLLCSNSSLWKEINGKLVQRKAIGTSLSLRCTIHGTMTRVETEDDFTKVPEGGCNRDCGAKLICGHLCKNICHLQDRDHNNYKCMEPCQRQMCENVSHVCKKRCFEKCGPCNYQVTRLLPCQHTSSMQCHIDPQQYKCRELVSTKLDCTHIEDKPCFMKIGEFQCPRICDNRLECGHACTLQCHVRKDPDHLTYKCTKPCAKPRAGCTSEEGPHICRNLCCENCEPCEVKVKKQRTFCSHMFTVPCNSNVDEIKCEKPCTRKMPCDHKCPKKCFEQCGPCEVKVEKIVPECRHLVKVKCSENPELKHCKQKCERQLPCGHGCLNKCNEPCTAICKVKVSCALRSTCGHIVNEIECNKRGTITNYDPYLLKCCTEPCKTTLKCEHSCKGTCGTCFQGRIHQRCGEKCGVFLICNHECPIPCRDACKPCERQCSYRCSHSSCKKKCGEICTKCKEECRRNCVHQKCKSLCGDICSVPPCKKPCPKLLNCGHPCIGFCNDPCPKKCRICDKDEITEVFFGTEDEEDARFVELQDCKHVLESSGIDNWLSQEDGEIQSKVCPKCKTPIINTQRYSDYVKKAIDDIDKTKKKLLGSPEENKQKRLQLLTRISAIQTGSGRLPSAMKFLEALRKLETRLQETRHTTYAVHRQPIDGLVLNSVQSKIQILEYILKIVCTPTGTYTSIKIDDQLNFILTCLLRDEDQITVQEIEDIELEMNRLKRLVELHRISITPTSRGLLSTLGFSSRSDKDVTLQAEIYQLVLMCKKYTKTIDDEVMSRLKRLNTRVPISDAERRDIVKALGLSKGHWFKCPKGHPYVITECGGAMQESRCPECGEKIGGSQHRLLSTNRLAPEMDGARFAAWSDVANDMGNFQL